MNNFQTKVLAQLFDIIAGSEPLKPKCFEHIDICHAGENYISDYTDMEPLMDRMGIAECPRDLYEFYELIGANKTIIMHDEFGDLDWNKHFEWPREKPFDIIVNCGKSAHIFNQYAFFDNIHRMAGEGTFMVHTVPFFSTVESSVYTYSPNIFARICAANQYEMCGAFIGTTTGERFSKMKISLDYALNRYSDEFKFNIWGNGEDKGYKRPAHVGVILRKTNNEDFQIPDYRDRDDTDTD